MKINNLGGITDSHILKNYVDQKDIDHAIAEHEARVTKSGLWLVLGHDLLFLVIIYFIVKFVV